MSTAFEVSLRRFTVGLGPGSRPAAS